MTRRDFLKSKVAWVGAVMAPKPVLGGADKPEDRGRVMTVNGWIHSASLGVTLSHEHVLVDFIGAEAFTPDRYDPDDVVRHVLPHLRRVVELGCQSLVECTPNYLGRDPALLKRLSAATGLHLLTNTGYYGARQNHFLPKHALTESAEALAARWIAEWRDGIGETGIRPGFIKIGVDGPALSKIHVKLVRAAALTHLETGLTIASHTGKGPLAMKQLELLKEHDVAPDAFVWVHAQSESDSVYHVRAAERGAWVSMDGFRAAESARYLERILAARAQGWSDRLLISHDAGWYRPGEPDGGVFRGFDEVFDVLLPKLREAALDREAIRGLMELNPAHAFTVRTRRT